MLKLLKTDVIETVSPFKVIDFCVRRKADDIFSYNFWGGKSNRFDKIIVTDFLGNRS